MIETLGKNVLDSAITYLSQVIETRLKNHFNTGSHIIDVHLMPRPENDGFVIPILQNFHLHELKQEEYLILLMALMPHIKPHFYDDIISRFLPDGGDLPQFGGIRGSRHRGFIPTGETALFILAGENLEYRFRLLELFGTEHFFYKKRILWIEETAEGEPYLSGKIILSQECVDLITQHKITKPRFGSNFPAQLLETEMDWNDLILNSKTSNQINELNLWLKHNHDLMYKFGMYKKFKPGYRVLFHGPPGTGKTFTATLLGKQCSRDVFKVDLSLMVSKYIGETEKNLSKLFDKAENKNWILFFDEADALFGKRTQVRDAHDRYANQEVSYLLQRVEQYDGLVILASNLKENIDDAFLRRFQSIVHFPLPNVEEKIQIFTRAFPKEFKNPERNEIYEVCKKYRLSGADIMNIILNCSVKSMERKDYKIKQEDILNFITKDFLKSIV